LPFSAHRLPESAEEGNERVWGKDGKEVCECVGEILLGDRSVAEPEGIEEAFVEFEKVERGEGSPAGEVCSEGIEGGVAGWSVCLDVN
jgi:hypothetical protein